LGFASSLQLTYAWTQVAAGRRKSYVVSTGRMRPNSSFKPNLLRYTNNMAGKACHVVGSATQVGLTQALDLRTNVMVTDTDEHFYERADAHIHLANDHMADVGRGKVSASFLYGAARFNVYVAACNCDSKDHMVAERQSI